MNAAVRNYCLRILPSKMSVPKATSFENNFLHGNPVIFHLHREGVSGTRHLLTLYCRHICAPLTWVNFNKLSPYTLNSSCFTSAKVLSSANEYCGIVCLWWLYNLCAVARFALCEKSKESGVITNVQNHK